MKGGMVCSKVCSKVDHTTHVQVTCYHGSNTPQHRDAHPDYYNIMTIFYLQCPDVTAMFFGSHTMSPYL